MAADKIRLKWFIKMQLFLTILVVTFSANAENKQISNNAISLEAPVAVNSENGILKISDSKNRTISISGPPFLTLRAEIDGRIYIPIIVAVITLLSSIYLSWKNHSLLKQQKWYDTWSRNSLEIYDKLFSLVVNAMLEPRAISKQKFETEFSRLEIQLTVFLPKSIRLRDVMSDLKKQLASEDLYKNRDAVYTQLGEIAKILVEEIKHD